MDGYRLKEFRKSLKMTQKELSEKTGLSLDQVKKLETGRNRLTSDKFREIKMRLINEPRNKYLGFKSWKI